MSTDPRDPIIIRRPTLLRRVRNGLLAAGNWLAACWRRISG